MSEDSEYSFIVHHVSITMDTDVIQQELMQQYNGVTQVTRLFREDEDGDDTPSTSIQVDFTSSDDAERIHKNRSIVIGGIVRRTRTVARPYRQRTFRPQASYTNNRRQQQVLCEQDIMNIIDNQKR